MALADKIRADWIDARKNRHAIHANLLGVLIGSIQTKEKNFSPQRLLSDAEIIKEVQSLLNGVVECKKLFNADHPNFLKAKEEELILSAYVPSQMSLEELTAVIKTKTDAGKDLKTIMTELRTEYAGQYDGKSAADLVKAAFVK